MKKLLQKYKRILIGGILILSITIFGIFIFDSPMKYYAIIDGSTNLGFVGEEFFNQRISDSVQSAKLNDRNPYLDENKILHHFRFIPLKKNISSLEVHFPNRNDTIKLTYSVNHNFDLPLKTNYLTKTKDSYNFNNLKLKKNDIVDIWMILNYDDINSLNRILDVENYFFTVNGNEKVNLTNTVKYFENINSYRYSAINYIIENPKFQIIIFLLVIYAFYVLFFKFKVSDVGTIIKKNKTSIKNILSIIVVYGGFSIAVYQFFVVQEPNEKQLEIYSINPIFIPSTPIYDMTVEEYGVAYPLNSITGGPDLEKAFTVPLVMRMDTIYLDYSYINPYIFKTISNYRVPNITILSSDNYENKYFSSFEKGIKQTRKTNDTISNLQGFSGTSKFSLFSKKPLFEKELKFHTENRVYRTTHRLKSISTFNSIDMFLTNKIIESKWIQITVMIFCYFGLINLVFLGYKKIKTIANNGYK